MLWFSNIVPKILKNEYTIEIGKKESAFLLNRYFCTLIDRFSNRFLGKCRLVTASVI